jgi:hypothetical protein
MSQLKHLLYAAAIGALATPAVAADFTVTELHAAANIATDSFKAEYGTALHDSIYGIQSTKRPDGGRIKLYYKANNTAQTIEYFCHYHHEEAMDCHEL